MSQCPPVPACRRRRSKSCKGRERPCLYDRKNSREQILIALHCNRVHVGPSILALDVPVTIGLPRTSHLRGVCMGLQRFHLTKQNRWQVGDTEINQTGSYHRARSTRRYCRNDTEEMMRRGRGQSEADTALRNIERMKLHF